MAMFASVKRLLSNDSSPLNVHTLLLEATRPVVENLEERRLLTGGPAGVVFPHMNLLGINNATIASGSSAYATANGTDFGSLDKSKSAVESFTIQNTGAGILNLTSVSKVHFTGANAADFTISSAPPATVLPNTSVKFQVKFQASTVGAETATMVIDNDTDGSNPYTVAIKGTGTAVAKAQITGSNNKIILSGDTVKTTTDGTDFGATESAQGVVLHTFTIKNNGSANLTFSNGTPVTVTGDNAFTISSQPTGPIAPGATGTFVVHFTPGTAGAHNAVISLASNDASSPYTFAVTGSGANNPVIKVTGTGSNAITNGSTSPVTTNGTDFGSVDLTTSVTGVTDTFNIADIGSASLALNGTPVFSLSGPDAASFRIVSQPANSLTAGANANVQVRFVPTTVGVKNATVTIANNDPLDVATARAFTFTIRGTATSVPKMQVVGANNTTLTAGQTATGAGDGTDFGTADLTQGGPTHTFTIKNLNLAALHVTGVSVSSSDFTVLTQPASTVNAPNGLAPHSAPAPKSRGVRMGHTHMSRKRHSPGTGAPGTGVATGASTFTIKFTPQDATVPSKSALVILSTDDPTNPTFIFSISGTAQHVPIAVVSGGQGSVAIANGNGAQSAANGTDFGSLDLNGTAITHTFTIANAGTDALTLSGSPLVDLSGTNADQFSVTQPSTTSYNSGDHDTFTVVFTPTAAGVKTATLTIASNDGGSPYVVNITGTALSVPVISVQGNSNTITPATNTPGTSDTTDFGNVEVNQASQTETYTILNTGSADAASVSAAVTGGANRNDFTIMTAPASASIANTSGSETFVVKFDPSNVGVRNAIITVSSSDPATPSYTFNVKGTGVRLPVIRVAGGAGPTVIANADTTPATLDGTDFGSTDTSAGAVTHTFSLRNIGSDALDLTNANDVVFTGAGAAYYSLTSKPRVSLAAGASGTFNVTFAPRGLSGAGDQPATLTIPSNDAVTGNYVFALDGMGVASPILSISGNSHTIPSGDTKPITLDSTDFGSTPVGTGVVKAFNANNTGGALLTLSGTPHVSIVETGGGSDFTIAAQPADTIAAGDSSTFVVLFNPAAGGAKTATITVASDDASSPYTFLVRGTGVVVPAISVSGFGTPISSGDTNPDPDDGTDFGSTEINTGILTQTFTITNNGGAALNLTNANKVVITGADFTLLTAPAATVASGASTTFTVKFKSTETTAGTRLGTITIPSNDPNPSPFTFIVQAQTVQAPALLVSGGTPIAAIANGQTTAATANGTDFGSAKSNSGTVVKTFTIKNAGSASMTLNGSPLVQIDGSDAIDFTASNPLATTLAAGATTTFTITYTPTSIGVENAVVSIASDDPTGGYSFAIKGTGTLN